MSGHGHPRLGPAAETVDVQRLQRRPLGQHHMQGTQLLRRLLDTQRREQLGVTGAGTEHHALCANLAAVDDQPAQFAIVLQRLDTLGSQQAVASQFGQTGDQARHIEHQLGQTIDLALELRMLQRWRQLLALDLIDPAAHRLAGEETGEVASQSTGRPQVMGIGKNAHAGQIQFARTGQRLAPAARHVGDGLGGAGQRAMQGILGTAMDDALRFQTLPAAQAAALHQNAGKALLTQASVEPEAGDTTANNQDIGAERLGHERASAKTGAQYNASAACPAAINARSIARTAGSPLRH